MVCWWGRKALLSIQKTCSEFWMQSWVCCLLWFGPGGRHASSRSWSMCMLDWGSLVGQWWAAMGIGPWLWPCWGHGSPHTAVSSHLSSLWRVLGSPREILPGRWTHFSDSHQGTFVVLIVWLVRASISACKSPLLLLLGWVSDCTVKENGRYKLYLYREDDIGTTNL